MWLHSVYVFPCCKFQISAIPAFRSPQHALYLLNSLALGHRDSTQVVRQCHCLSQSNQQLCLECRQLKFASLVQCSGPRFIEADRPCASLKLLSEQKLSFERTKNQIKADHFNFISLQKPWKLQYFPRCPTQGQNVTLRSWAWTPLPGIASAHWTWGLGKYYLFHYTTLVLLLLEFTDKWQYI